MGIKYLSRYTSMVICCLLLLSCKDTEPDPQPTPVDPCVIQPGTVLTFGDLIYVYDEQGWPLYVTTNDTVGQWGSSYRRYRYGGGVMTFTEHQLDNGSFSSWDSLDCSGANCTHYTYQSDVGCTLTGSADPCEHSMTLNIGNWVLTDGPNSYHYNSLLVLDSISYPDSTLHFSYFQGRISQIFEKGLSGDTVAIQTFTFNSEGQWREFERVDMANNLVQIIRYTYDEEGKIEMVSVGYGPPPVTLTDYSVLHEGCGELPRNLDPLNVYRLPHMHFRYIGMPW